MEEIQENVYSREQQFIAPCAVRLYDIYFSNSALKSRIMYYLSSIFDNFAVVCAHLSDGVELYNSLIKREEKYAIPIAEPYMFMNSDGGIILGVGTDSTPVGLHGGDISDRNSATALGDIVVPRAHISSYIGPITSTTGYQQGSVALGRSTIATGANSIQIGRSSNLSQCQPSMFVAIGDKTSVIAFPCDSYSVIGIHYDKYRTVKYQKKPSKNIVLTGVNSGIIIEKYAKAKNITVLGSNNNVLVKNGAVIKCINIIGNGLNITFNGNSFHIAMNIIDNGKTIVC